MFKEIYIENTFYNIQHTYKKNLLAFKNDVKKFTYLKLNEEFASENMSIKCIDFYNDNDIEEKTYTFYWNHFQRGDKTILTIEIKNNKISYFSVDSPLWIFETDTDQIYNLDFSILCKNWVLLDHCYGWFTQLVHSLYSSPNGS